MVASKTVSVPAAMACATACPWTERGQSMRLTSTFGAGREACFLGTSSSLSHRYTSVGSHIESWGMKVIIKRTTTSGTRKGMVARMQTSKGMSVTLART